MSKFNEKRLEYFKKAALNSDHVRLGKGDVELFELTDKVEINALKEEIAHHLRRIERFKGENKFLRTELDICYEELGIEKDEE